MRIVVHGQDAFGRAVLEKLLERGETVVAVFCAPDKDGKARDPLAAFAEENGLPLHQPASWKTPEALELITSYKADLCVMAYVLLFVPQPVILAPTHGSIQYHPSLLPMHRGPSSINWPIAMGATKTGLTIFYPNDGLDEGDILLQKACDIGPDETIGDVYFKKLFPMGVEAMMEAVDLVRAGKAPRIVQDLSKGSYESWFKKDLAQIDWSKSAAEVYNIIRAANPAPGAWASFKGQKVDIFDSAKVSGAGAAGEVLDVAADGITVAAGGGAILVKRVRLPKAQKIAASEFAATVGMKAGDRFDGVLTTAPPVAKS
jgi:methionyl-tRNA formyltransferase